VERSYTFKAYELKTPRLHSDKIAWSDFKQALPGPLGRRAGARSNDNNIQRIFIVTLVLISILQELSSHLHLQDA